jgi:hypothetical protein
MKTGYGAILALTMAVVLSTAVLPCRAAEDVNKNEDNIWLEDIAKGEHGQFELTAEKIEHIMRRLAESDPNKAEQLKQLQQKDPENFKSELRKVMRQQISERFKERGERQQGQMRPMRMRGEPSEHGRRPPEMGMRWRIDKYLDWLKANYPDEAAKLAELSEKDMDLYQRQLNLSLKKYGRIAEAAAENPKLAEVLKKDLALREQQDKLLGAIETANDKEKEELIKELNDVISNRFDVIVERKQIEYEQLLGRLEMLKKDIEQRKTRMEKWKDAKFKEDSVKARLEELLGKSDKFTW